MAPLCSLLSVGSAQLPLAVSPAVSLLSSLSFAQCFLIHTVDTRLGCDKKYRITLNNEFPVRCRGSIPTALLPGAIFLTCCGERTVLGPGAGVTCRLTACGVNPSSKTDPDVSDFFPSALGRELAKE